MMTLEAQTTKQAAHTPTFANKMPDGYLECRDCGRVMDMEAWTREPCRPKQEGER